MSAVEDRASPGGLRSRSRFGGRGLRGGERKMVPDATFTSYYGRPIVKASPWGADIPAYLFLGGVAAGSSLLAAGADLTKRSALRRTTRLGAVVALAGSFVALVHDLGRPARFANMLRVAKPTSPMSVGTWILSAYGPVASVAGFAELASLLPGRHRRGVIGRTVSAFGRPAGMTAALIAPALASYTAVLLSNTATPSWHEARRELPFVFVGSAAAASGGLGMIGSPVSQAGPARRMALIGVILETVAEWRMEESMGITAEPLHQGRAQRYWRAQKVLSVGAAAATLIAGRRSRTVSFLAGLALLFASALVRFGIFEAGQASARDPKYTVVPQRERADGARGSADESVLIP
ncbi:MAG TPA: NrfD/PsrC family molybdoenzyme membrane anchor subunit [Acidimicrobiales bacterium]